MDSKILIRKAAEIDARWKGKTGLQCRECTPFLSIKSLDLEKVNNDGESDSLESSTVWNDWLINCYFKMDVNNSINNNNRHKILPNTSN